MRFRPDPVNKKAFWNRLDSSGKRNSLVVVSLTFLGTLLGFLILKNDPQTNSFMINIFTLTLLVQAAVIILIIIGQRLIARVLALVFLWVTFTVIGLAQPGASMVMVAGYLVLTVISGYSFHLSLIHI